MSSISMEWLGGPIVLNLCEAEIMVDLDEGYAPATTDGPANPDGPASLTPPVILETTEALEMPTSLESPANPVANSANEAA